jgi:hypothetical protein
VELYWILILLAVLFVWGSATALQALDRYAVKKDESSEDE